MRGRLRSRSGGAGANRRVWPGRLVVLVTLVVLTGFTSLAGAQIGAAALAGDVTDQVGAPVPGASVTVVAAGTNAARTVVTGRDGSYLVPGLRPGSTRFASS